MIAVFADIDVACAVNGHVARAIELCGGPCSIREAKDSRGSCKRRHDCAGRNLANGACSIVRNVQVAAAVHRGVGVVNRAAEPVPSVVPIVPAMPAMVVTTPAGVTLRIVLPLASAT